MPYLHWLPVNARLDLVGDPVRPVVTRLPDVRVAEIDPALADTAALCAYYGVPLDHSANCVIVSGRRGDVTTYAAVMVLATMQADVNGVVRRRLGARKASFASQDQAVGLSGMEYGGITPIGLPEGWPVLIDLAVVDAGEVIIGSGIRASKLLLSSTSLLALTTAEPLALSR